MDRVRKQMLKDITILTGESEDFIIKTIDEAGVSLELLLDILTTHRVRAMVKRNCAFCTNCEVCAKNPAIRDLCNACAPVNMWYLSKLEVFRD